MGAGRWFGCLLCVLAICPAPIRAHGKSAGGLGQTFTSADSNSGSIKGQVHGPGGIAVPGATVQITNLQTGESKETWTGPSGSYSFPALPPGSYKITISLLGFRPFMEQPIAVTAGKPLKLSNSLSIATPQQEQATSAGSSNPNFRRRAAAGAIPSAGQEMSSAGATTGTAQQSVRFSTESGESSSEPESNASASSGPETGAQASSANSFLLSGSIAQAPTPEGNREQRRERYREFRQQMQAGQNIPGFGGRGGGFGGNRVFIAGGFGRRPRVNRLRGNIMESYTNSAFDASPYPLNVPESPQIPSYRERFGASLGGPLNIPKIYHGGNKTSFFVHYTLQRGKNGSDNFATVPTLAERQGDFSQAVIPSGQFAGTVPTIYEPSSVSGPRTPFPGNMIPSINSAAAGLLKYIPTPNLPGSVQNLHFQESLPTSINGVMARVQHQLSARDSLSVMYFLNTGQTEFVSNFPELTSTNSSQGQNVNLSESHTFSSHVVNRLMFNFSRYRILRLNPFAYQQNIEGALGIQGTSQNPFDWGLPLINFTNFTGLNDMIPSLSRNQTARLFDFILWNRGKHNMRFGGELRRVDLNTLTDPDARGTFTFSGFTTSDFSSDGFPVPGTGFDFADFLLGLPQATTVRFGDTSNYFRSWVYSGFAQDDWRMASRLTFDFGLRYEYFQPFTEKYGHLSDLAIAPGFSTASVITGLEPGSLPSSLIRSRKNNFAPRIGTAFRPWGQHSLVLRAGYGLFYDGSIYQRLVPNLANQPPFAQASTLLTSPTEILTLENGFPQIGPNIIKNTYAVDPNFLTPYGQTWNASLEDEIARGVMLSVSYIGTRGTHLDLLLSPNQASAGSPLTTQQRLNLANALQFTYETSGASSIYNALQVDLRRQFHNGFSLNSTYTYSKSIDDAASVGGAGQEVVAQNPFDLQAERGLSSFDMRHQVSIFGIYELPAGADRHWLRHGGVLAKVLGGWTVSSNAEINSGTPFTARVLGNVGNSGGTGASFSERADATGQPVSLPGSEQTTLRFFNTNAFALPPQGQLGNAGKDTIPGPGGFLIDASLSKQVTISREKGMRASFRIQADNLFNTPNYESIATVINASNFGRVTSVGQMRSLSLMMRFSF